MLAPAAAKKKAKVDVPKPLPAAPAPFSGVPPVKFPTFKRAAPAAPVQTAFQKAMSSMAGNTPAPQNPVPVPVIAPVVALPAPKKKKTVRFKDDAELEQVRIIERAIYDDDAKDESGERVSYYSSASPLVLSRVVADNKFFLDYSFSSRSKRNGRARRINVESYG